MTWADEIDTALTRAGSPYQAGDLIRWLCSGTLKLAVGNQMHGSLWFRPDGEPEIAHLYGNWNEEDALWLFSKLKEYANGRFVEIKGRPGWERFLKMKGWNDGRIGRF